MTLRVLVWQWGRRGAGPLVAAVMARELAAVAGVETCVSLSTGAELLQAPGAPTNELPVPTYAGLAGFAGRLLCAPWFVRALARRIEAARVDVALCAMPAPLDLLMATALRRAGVPYAVVVHDAQLHPGDVFPLQIRLQDRLVRGASALFALSDHVAAQLRHRRLDAGRPLLMASHPPFAFWPPPPRVGAHGGPFRLLSFGRLLPYKGLDLLADAIARLGPRDDLVIRVVGSGPASPELDRLRALPNVSVENRWVPEAEIGTLLGWADGLVLSHREASQSGVAAAALGARRWVVATRVGGLVEQLQDQDMALLSAPEPGALAQAIASLPARSLPEGPGGPAWTGVAEAMVAGLRQVPRRAPASGAAA